MYTYRECRVLLHHAWNLLQISPVPKSSKLRVALTCTRCHMVRTLIVGHTGESLKNSYKQPKGYRLHHFDAAAKNAMRKALITTYQRRKRGKA